MNVQKQVHKSKSTAKRQNRPFSPSGKSSSKTRAKHKRTTQTCYRDLTFEELIGECADFETTRKQSNCSKRSSKATSRGIISQCSETGLDKEGLQSVLEERKHFQTVFPISDVIPGEINNVEFYSKTKSLNKNKHRCNSANSKSAKYTTGNREHLASKSPKEVCISEKSQLSPVVHKESSRINTAAFSSGIQKAKLSSGIHNCKSLSGICNVESSSGIRNAKSSSGICNAKSSSGMQNAKSSSGIHNGKSLSGIRNARCSSGIHNARSSSGIHNAKSSSGMHNARSSSGIHNARSSSGIHNARSSSGIHNARSSSGIHNGKSLSGIHNAKSSSGNHNTNLYSEKHCVKSSSGIHSVNSCSVIHNDKSSSGIPAKIQKTKPPSSKSRHIQQVNTNHLKKEDKYIQELDMAVTKARSKIRKSKSANTIHNDHSSLEHEREPRPKSEAKILGENFWLPRKTLNDLLQEHSVIRDVKTRLDDGDTNSLRRYALYRSMVKSSRMSDFLSNKIRKTDPWPQYTTTEDDYFSTNRQSMTDYEKDQPKTTVSRRKLIEPKREDEPEPDIPPEKWDLMGTTLPKRVYIRETINGCVIDEIVDIKDEKDWEILTYMSPLRQVDVTHHNGRVTRDLSFADIKDFAVYTYASPWRIRS